MRWLLALVAAAWPIAASGPRIFFSKSFPGSQPDYYQVTLAKDGSVEYAEAKDDDDPLRFRLSERDANEIFGLAAKVDYFQHALESPRKVANLGAKTFRYEDGERKSEVKFNFSEDLSAQALLDWFERMSQAARDRIDLERTAKYDKLGVDQAVAQLGSDIDRKRVAGLDQFLPILDRIANSEAYMHTARQQSAVIAEAIRKGQ